MIDWNSNLWQNTMGYGARAPKLAYLSDEQNCLAEKIRVGRMLYTGRHRCCFLDEGRTQWNFPEMRVQGRVMRPYAALNLLRRFTNTLTDLLLGEEPLLRSDQQDVLDELARRSELPRVMYDAVREASWASFGTVEVIRWGGATYVQNVPPGELFPIGVRNPDGQFSSYKRFATAEATLNGMKQKLLLETTYLPGQITRELYKLEGANKTDRLSDLSLWPATRADGSALLEKEPTGIDWNTIVWVPNELEEGNAISDYDGSSLIELQDELNAKNTQIARVLAKHSDPKLAAPQPAGMAGGTLFSDHDVYFFKPGETLPSYITWNAELASAVTDRDFVVDAMCISSEVGQILLGLKKGATPDAARKVRLEAIPTLAKVKRKASYVRPFIRTVIDTAVAMENSSRVVKVSMTSSLELRDGLPVDDLDEANALSILTAGKQVMSVERAVRQQLPDPEAADKEIEQIKEEQSEAAALATPSINIGGNTPLDQNNQPQQVAA